MIDHQPLKRLFPTPARNRPGVSLRFLAFTLLILSLVGCSTQMPRQMSYHPRGAPEGRFMTFPPTKDGITPRYLYLGELTGEANFVGEEDKPVTIGDVFTWLVGLVKGEDIPRVLSRPQGGTVDPQGRILVTDFGQGAIFVFDEKNGRLEMWFDAGQGARFLAPIAIVAVGSEGFLVSDGELNVVVRLAPDGTPRGWIGRGLFQRPTGLAYDHDMQRIFVADTPTHRILVFDLEGRLIDIWGEPGDSETENGTSGKKDRLRLNTPTHLALANGRLYISDTMNARIVIASAADGEHLGTIGARGVYVGNLVRPKGIGLDAEGNLYVVESYHDHLLIYDRQGRFLLPIGGEGTEPGKFNLPAGLWIDGRNRVFIADSHNARVQIFQFLGGDRESGD